MSHEYEKQQAAQAALRYIVDDMAIGIGTGSTVNYFIQALADSRLRIAGAVSSSEQSTQLLKSKKIPLLELNNTGDLPLYIDGADECDPHKRLIKGGGGALTREKILAAASQQFVCLIDSSKRVDLLGQFPLPIEVIPMARSYVARQIVKHGGQPVWRQGFTTDNGNIILDAHHLKILDPPALEQTLNQIPGVVSVGLFAQRKADIVICGSEIL